MRYRAASFLMHDMIKPPSRRKSIDSRSTTRHPGCLDERNDMNEEAESILVVDDEQSITDFV
ncbi:MAG: hypothetical protein ACLTQI_09070, partial [Slackia sp.]